MMMTVAEYREQLKVVARGLTQEGLSQTAIAKELGMDRRTVGRWQAEERLRRRREKLELERQLARLAGRGGRQIANNARRGGRWAK